MEIAANSTHRVEVVPVVLEPHPNADSLSVVRVWGYTVCVRTADWQGIDRGAYIPPDSLVPDTEQFAFLSGSRRIRVKRLRGIVSMGLLVPAPASAAIGDDVAEQLGVEHYNPPEHMYQGGEDIAPPAGYRPTYDVDSFRRYSRLFVPGEPVLVTEKLHGASARYCCVDGQMFCGSRTAWKREVAGNLWWRILTPEMIHLCQSNPDCTLYGEAFGYVQDLKYGRGKGEATFASFDILRGGDWLNAHECRALCEHYGVPTVPLVYDGPFDAAAIEAMAEGQSLISGANHIREGVVVKPAIERRDDHLGRVQLKIVGNGYLEHA